MIAKCDQCHPLVSTHSETNIQIASVTIESFSTTKLLAVTFDNKLRLN